MKNYSIRNITFAAISGILLCIARGYAADLTVSTAQDSQNATYANLTITGTGNYTINSSSSSSSVTITNQFKLEDGAVVNLIRTPFSTSESGQAAVKITGYGASLLMDGGSFSLWMDENSYQTTTSSKGILMTGTGSSIQINDGVFTNNVGRATGIMMNGTNTRINVNGGDFINIVTASSPTSGYGIVINGSGGQVNVSDGSFRNDLGGLSGGTNYYGIYNNGSSGSINVSGGRFDNIATSGVNGAVRNQADSSYLSMTGGTFNNTVSGGAGIYNNGASSYVSVTGGVFNNNVTAGNGIYSELNRAQLRVGGSGEFYNNVTGGDSGNGIYGTLLMDGGSFVNNVTDGGSSANTGTGLYLYSTGTYVKISGGIFTNTVGANSTGILLRSSGTGYLELSGAAQFNQTVTGGTGIDLSTSSGPMTIKDTALFTSNVTAGTGINTSNRIVMTGGTFRQTVSGDAGVGIRNTGILQLSGIDFRQNITSPGIGIHNTRNITMTSGNFTNTVEQGTGIYNEADNLGITMTGGNFTQAITGDAIGILNEGKGSFLKFSGGEFRQTRTVHSTEGMIRNSGEGSHLLVSGGHFISTTSTGSAIVNSGTNSYVTISDGVFENSASGTGIRLSGVGSSLNIEGGLFKQTTTGGGIGVSISGMNSRVYIGPSGTVENNAVYGAGFFVFGTNSILEIDGGNFYQYGAGNGISINSSGNMLVKNTTNVTIDSSATADGGGIRNAGTVRVQEAAGITLLGSGNAINNNSTSSKLIVDGTVDGAGKIRFSAGLVAGAGSISNLFMDGTQSKTISPGSYSSSGVSSAGTLSFTNSQAWDRGFTYEWQLGNVSAIVGGQGNDFVNITGSLSLNATGSYSVNASSLIGANAVSRDGIAEWIILGSSGGITDFVRDNWTTSKTSSINSSLRSGHLFAIQSGNNIVLKYVGLDAPYYWRAGQGDGIWAGHENWETDLFPDGAGLNIYAVRDQAGTANINMAGATRTLGNLTIGSENGTLGTAYHITGGVLSFDADGSSSTLRHHANSQGTDTISADITSMNDLVIDVQSSGGASLVMGGNISNNGYAFTRTGGGNLTLNLGPSNSILNSGTMLFEEGNTTLVSSSNAGLNNSGTIEVKGGNFITTVNVNSNVGINNTLANSNVIVSGTGNIILSSSSGYGRTGIRNHGAGSGLIVRGNGTVTHTGNLGVINAGDGSHVLLEGNATYNAEYTDSYGIMNNGDNSYFTLKDDARYKQKANTDAGVALGGNNSSLNLEDRAQFYHEGEGSAFEVWGSNSTIRITDNASLTLDISSSSTGINAYGDDFKIIVDGNGHYTQTLGTSSTGISTTGAKSVIEVKGSGEFINKAGSGVGINLLGNLILSEKGRFENTVTGGSGIRLQGGSSLEIKDEGTFINNVTSGGNGIVSAANTEIIISGGNFINDVSAGNGIWNVSGNILLSGGAVFTTTMSSGASTANGILNQSGNMVVSNATLRFGDVSGTNSTVGIRNIQGGNLLVTDAARVELSEGKGIVNESGTITISNATLVGSSNVTVNETHMIENQGSFLVTDKAQLTLSRTQTIQRAASIYNTGTFTINGGATVTIDDYNAEYYSIHNTGTFRIEGADTRFTMNQTNREIRGIYNTGTLIIDNATFTNTYNGNDYAISSSGGQILITGSSANVTIKTGSYSGWTGGVALAGNSRFTITDGASFDLTSQRSNSINMSSTTATFTINGGAQASYNFAGSSNGNGIYNVGKVFVSGEGTKLSGTAYGYNGANNNGTFTVNQGAVFENFAKGATAGIRNAGSAAVFTVDNATLDNELSASGNGIYNAATFTINGVNARLISRSLASGNGINNNSGTFTIRNGAMLNSTHTGAGGSGINNSATLLVNNATFENTLNTTGATANGISNWGEFKVLDGSTFNSTTAGSAGSGIYNFRNITVSNATLNMFHTGTGGDGINNSAQGNISLSNSAQANIDNATVVNAGNFSVDSSSTLTLREGARIINTGNFVSGSILQFTGGNHLLAGTSFDADLRNITSTTRLSPGSFNTVSGVSSLGTLNIKGSQSWTNGFIYDWQFGSATDTGTGANDWLNIDGSLNLSASANYLLNLGWVGNPNGDGITAGMTWTLLTASLGITNFDADTWNNNTLFQSSMEALIDQLGLTGKGKFVIQQDGSGNILQLVYELLVTTFFWKTNTSGSWDDTNSWEDGVIPVGVSSNVYLISNQTSSTGEADLGGSRKAGNLTLGSENASATDTHYKLINGTLTLDNNGNLSVIHHHLNAQGDEIAVTLNASNAVEIDIASKGNSSLENQSIGFTPSGETEWGRWNGKITNATLSGSGSNPILTISGNLQMNGHDLSKTGNGTLVVSGDILGAHQIVHNAGSLYLDGTVNTNSDLTVAGQAILGGSGTIVGALIFEHQAIFRQGREGAAYNNRLKVSGNALAQGSMTFDLTAALGRAFSDNDGDSRKTAAQSSGLDLTGLFAFNAASSYTVNIYNLTDFNIVDWTREKNANEGAYYQLLSWEGGDGDIDLDKWSLNFLGSVRPDDPGAWSLKLGKEGDKHILWLYYANPVRIPEPGTYAAIASMLALSFVLLRRRRK